MIKLIRRTLLPLNEGSVHVWFTSSYVRDVRLGISAKPRGIYSRVCVSTRLVIGPLTFSDIYKILNNVALYVLMNALASFDHASITLLPKIKEAIFIRWGQPSLNVSS